VTDLFEAAARPQRRLVAKSDRGTRATQMVLDTSALIADPESVFAFPGAAAIIPLVVIEELDQLKTRPDDVGRAAREVIRTVEALRCGNGGDIGTPVPLPDGGTLHIETRGLDLDAIAHYGLEPSRPDNRILAAALGHRHDDQHVVVVSNDAALRIKAAQVGLEAREHHRDRGSIQAARDGVVSLEVPPEVIDRLYADRVGIAIDDAGADPAPPKRPNTFAVLRSGSQSALCRSDGTHLHPLLRRPTAWGLHPRSKEQQFALELLCDSDVSVVALDGTAGTGKTILALAAGLEQVVEQSHYDRLCVYRPVVPVGKAEVGFLPGSLEDKLSPWMGAITDALVALTERRSHADARMVMEELIGRDKLLLDSVTHLRGRSLHGSFIVVDEAQNLEATTLKTILTRVAEGSKVIFTGDTSQIDAPYLSERNNAVSVLIDAFAGEPCFGHVTLRTCERSQVASIAALRL
jgi:PhoH-like ATPase